MADPEQLALIKSGVAEWNTRRSDNPREYVDLRDADLDGAPFSGVILTLADLRGALLRHATLDHADLEGANLTRADLTAANLRVADLGGADLRGANLERAQLSGANCTATNLSGANLQRAELTNTIFTDANLSGTDLSAAHLGGANFSGASLRGAHLANASIANTVFGDTDLSAASGLESCVHTWHSIVDHRTLEKSGRIPVNFLHNAGLPDQLIELFVTSAGRLTSSRHLAATNPVTGQLLFISARRLDALSGFLPFSHLSLVMRNKDGDEHEYAGGPRRALPGAYGPIVVTKRPYRPRPDRHSLRVPFLGHELMLDAIAILDAELDRINAANVAYDPLTGPNSNTVARTLLLSLGMEPLHPAAIAPGFDHEAL